FRDGSIDAGNPGPSAGSQGIDHIGPHVIDGPAQPMHPKAHARSAGRKLGPDSIDRLDGCRRPVRDLGARAGATDATAEAFVDSAYSDARAGHHGSCLLAQDHSTVAQISTELAFAMLQCTP